MPTEKQPSDLMVTPTPQPVPEGGVPTIGVGLRVLLVEDSEDDALLLLRELRRAGYAVSHRRVEDLASFAEALDTDTWDAIIADFILPGFGGMDAWRLVQARGFDVPFIMVSGVIGEEVAVEAMRAGVHDYVLKSSLRRLPPAIERERREALVRRERREAEEALRRNRLELQQLIELLPDGVALHRDGVLVYANPAWASLLAVQSPLALTGRAVLEMVHPDDRTLALDRVFACGAPPGQETELRLLRADGGPAVAEVITGPAVSYDRARAGMVVARDVTAWRAMEARMRVADRMASVGTLASGIAHQVNNPLAFIASNLEYLGDGLADIARGVTADVGEMLAAVHEAREGAARVQRIVHDLGTFARGETDRGVPVDVRKVLDLTLRVAEAALSDRATVEKQYGEVLPVRADEAQLGQVFLNLLLNASQAIAPGNPRENRVCLTVGAEGPWVRVSIADTGAGMAPNTVRRLFDPFFTSRVTGTGTGTGLGLAVSYGIVTALGGEITVTSTEGHGTTFTVSLPAVGEPSGG